jgi:hypothetical protein
MRDYDQFVERWPDLERWFAAPLLPRFGCRTDIPETSTETLLYLAYLSLVRGLPLDTDYVLGSRLQGLLTRRTGAALGLDLALLDDYADRIGQLGYDRRTRTALTWALPRLALIRGRSGLHDDQLRGPVHVRSGDPPLQHSSRSRSHPS